jgi:anti-sigma B factor antagonist
MESGGPMEEVSAPAGFRFGGQANFAFGISVSERGSVATLELSGEFDLASNERFDFHLRHLLSGNPDHVVVDLRGLTFIDTSGLQLLIRAYALSLQDGFHLWVVCAGEDRIRQTLEVSGFTGLVPLSPEPPSLPF